MASNPDPCSEAGRGEATARSASSCPGTVPEPPLNEALAYMAPPLYARTSKPAAVSTRVRREGGAAFERLKGLLPWMLCFVPATFSKLLSHHSDSTLLQKRLCLPCLFVSSPLFSRRAGSIRRDSSPSLKGRMHVAPIKMAELSPVNCNGTCNVQSISVAVAFSEGLF